MNRIIRTMAILSAAVLLASITAPCFAAENAFKEIYEDSLYGGLAGTLIGTALLAFTRKPTDHLDRIGYGAAAGVLLGAGYGLVKTTRSLAEMENGKVRFSMPTIIPDIQEPNSKGQTPIIVMAEFFRGKF